MCDEKFINYSVLVCMILGVYIRGAVFSKKELKDLRPTQTIIK